MSNHFVNWLKGKIAIANKLYLGECGGTYDEAAIILCSIISGMASEMWPGKRIEGFRFVELLTTYCDPVLSVKRISIPLLIQWLKKQNKTLDLSKLYNKFSYPHDWDTIVLIGKDVDNSEKKVTQQLPKISLKKIREFCYANILYKQIRCGYMHEYKPNNFASTHSHTSRNVSYVNNIDIKNHKRTRKIYFHFEWLKKVIESIIVSTEPLFWDKIPLEKPKKWWIEGG